MALVVICPLVVLGVKNLLAHAGDEEMWISSLGWEDPLKEGMATHSTFFSGESHGQRSLAGYSPWGSKGLDMMSTHMRTPGTVAWELGPRASLSGNQPVKMLGPHSECQSLSPSSITLPAPSLK